MMSDIHKEKTKAEQQDQSVENEINDQVEETQAAQSEDHEAAIARLEEELAQTRDSLFRKAAEFENLKKRIKKEKTYLFEDARIDAIINFLPIREDLKRSLEAARDQDVNEGFLHGLQMVLHNFDSVLEEYHVEPIEETGVPFNVDKHDAMLTQPVDNDLIESNTVIQIMEPGYKIGDRVIKHAKVIVSQ